MDEAALALNIRERDLHGLAQPLDYTQGAPLGFLWAVKLLTMLFGQSERVLRLWPLAVSLTSLVLVMVLARRVLPGLWAALAVGLFALNDPAVYYAAELKQYSTDTLVALCLLLQAESLASAPTRRRWSWFAVSGMVGVWFSHPAPLVLAVTGTFLGTLCVAQRGWRAALPVVLVVAGWLASFALCWLVSLQAVHHEAVFRTMWGKCFLPIDGSVQRMLGWLSHTTRRVFEDPGGFRFIWPWLPVAALGIWALLRRNWRHAALLLLLWPLLLALAAAQLYPLCFKFIQFMGPPLLLTVVAGLFWMHSRLHRARATTRAVAGVLLAGLVLADPAASAWQSVRQPRTVEEIRPVLEFVRAHREPEDSFYIYYSAQWAWRYYAGAYGLPADFIPDPFRVVMADPERLMPQPADPRLVIGSCQRTRPAKYRTELERLRGRGRVWIVFSHTVAIPEGPEEALFLGILRGLGTELLATQAPGSSAYLFHVR